MSEILIKLCIARTLFSNTSKNKFPYNNNFKTCKKNVRLRFNEDDTQFLNYHLEVFIRVIGSISDGCHSIRLHFGSVFFRLLLQRVTLGSSRLVTVRMEIGYSSYRVSISSVSVEVRVECQSVSGCHRLLIGSVLSGTDQVRVFFLKQNIINYYRLNQYQIKLLVNF